MNLEVTCGVFGPTCVIAALKLCLKNQWDMCKLETEYKSDFSISFIPNTPQIYAGYRLDKWVHSSLSTPAPPSLLGVVVERRRKDKYSDK